MNINLIKEKIKSLCDVKIKIKINLGRNKYEYHEGFIDKIHPNIFTVKTSNCIKTFTYTDVLIKNVVISKFI